MSEFKPEKVYLELDSERWEVKYDFNALVDIEDYFGTIEKAFSQENVAKFKTIRYLLWEGCVHSSEFKKKYPSPVIFGRKLILKDIEKYASAITKAFENAFPPANQEKKEEPPPAK